jgi:hypothetical protein
LAPLMVTVPVILAAVFTLVDRADWWICAIRASVAAMDAS